GVPHAALTVLRLSRLAFFPPAHMREKHSVRPFRAGAVEQRPQTATLDLLSNGSPEPRSCDLRQSGEYVDVCRELVDIVRSQTARPAPEGCRACAAEPRRYLRAPHSRVEDLNTAGPTVVVHEDDQCVALNSPSGELLQQPPDVIVDVGD